MEVINNDFMIELSNNDIDKKDIDEFIMKYNNSIFMHNIYKKYCIEYNITLLNFMRNIYEFI